MTIDCLNWFIGEGRMPIKIEIVAESFEEMKEKVASLAIGLGMGGFGEAPPAEIKKSRPAKEKKTEPVPAPEPTPSAPTLEVASAKLKAVNDTKGLIVAREILAFVGANRLSEVSPDKYEAVIAECEKRLA